MKDLSQLPAIFTKISSRADRSYKLEFETRELGADGATNIMKLLHDEGWLLFSPNQIQDVDVPQEKADSMTGQKTPSKRLYACIFKVWQTNGQQGDFDDFYKSFMEGIIDKVKERIAEE